MQVQSVVMGQMLTSLGVELGAQLAAEASSQVYREGRHHLRCIVLGGLQGCLELLQLDDDLQVGELGLSISGFILPLLR